MREDDLQSGERTSAVTFYEADQRTRRVGEPVIQPRVTGFLQALG